MEQFFRLDANINAMQGAIPIRVAHHKTLDNPGNHVLHINNYIEIYVYVSGNHNYIVENTVYELKRGDVVVINPLEVHKALPLSRSEYERFYFLVDIHTFDAMCVDPLSAFLKKPLGAGNLISFPEEKREEILSVLYTISACFRDGRDDQLRAFTCFMRLLDALHHQMLTSGPSAGTVTRTPALLEKILAYVAENTASIQSITEIADTLGLSPQYLSGYFSKQVGTPLKTYVQAKKIALAKDLLDKGADVTEACYECGFNDCSYFIRVFKKYVGMTPLSYKNSMPKKQE